MYKVQQLQLGPEKKLLGEFAREHEAVSAGRKAAQENWHRPRTEVLDPQGKLIYAFDCRSDNPAIKLFLDYREPDVPLPDVPLADVEEVVIEVLIREGEPAFRFVGYVGHDVSSEIPFISLGETWCNPFRVIAVAVDSHAVGMWDVQRYDRTGKSQGLWGGLTRRAAAWWLEQIGIAENYEI